MVKTERKRLLKKRHYRHDFTSKICWKRLSPIPLEEISRGTGRAVPGVYTDRYQVLPGHRGLTALPSHGTRIELMIPQINHILTSRNKSKHTYRKVIFNKLIMQGETFTCFLSNKDRRYMLFRTQSLNVLLCHTGMTQYIFTVLNGS